MMSEVDTKVRIKEIFSKQRAFAPTIANSSKKERIAKLDKLYDYLIDEQSQQRLLAALKADMGKPAVEAIVSEISVVLGSIRHIKRHLGAWMQNQTAKTPLTFFGAKSYVRYEPKGNALIISPWNYPFQLCVNPLLYAMAAGCTAILKPSEFAEHTANFIAKMVQDLFDPQEVAVFQGGIPVSQELLSLPFNHMYFTGSPPVGKIVMKAASEHLASVTLELGGKSPCIVDDSANIKEAASKIAWGKFFNCGQTCIAPDYVLVPSKKADQLTSELKVALQANYGDVTQLKANSDFGRIVNHKHFDKLASLLADAKEKGATVLLEGEPNREEKFFPPTILFDATDEMDIMKEEIFGPILPVRTYHEKAEVISTIRSKPKPLALYVLGKNKKNIEYFLKNTTSGGAVVNDFLIHFANHNLPFGGVNNSGIGKSHGFYGFQAFSNERGTMVQRWNITKMLHPPYNETKVKIARWSKFFG